MADAISRVFWNFKTRSAEDCSLSAVNHYQRTPLQSSCWRFSLIFKTTSTNFVKGSLLVTLQLANSSKFLEELNFEHINACNRGFDRVSGCRNFSYYLAKK